MIFAFLDLSWVLMSSVETACYVITTSWLRLKMLRAATSFQLQNSQILNFSSSVQIGLLKIRLWMSHGMHQAHITTPSAPVLLWCLWEQTVLVWRTWDVCLFSIITWPQLTPSAESKSVTSFEPLKIPSAWACTGWPILLHPTTTVNTHCAIKLQTAGKRQNPKGGNGVISKNKIAVKAVKWLRSSAVSCSEAQFIVVQLL